MSRPLISVVVPSFNHERFIGEAIRSALEQQGLAADAYEVIVVDDGSTDGTRAVLAGLRDPRLRILLQDNRGAHAALDRGIAESRGAYVAILNSDDRFTPDRLRRTLDAFEQDSRLALVGSHVSVIDEAGRPHGVKRGFENLDPWPVTEPERTFKAEGDLRLALLLQNYWATTSNFVMPREVYERHGPFRPLRYCHDWDFALRVQLHERARLIGTPLVEYRLHDTNTIREDQAAMVYEICWLYAVHLPRYLGEAEFWEAAPVRRAEQVLRSTHVYGSDRIAWQMTMLMAFGPAGSAEALLLPDHPLRALYLDEIARVLTVPPGSSSRAGGLSRLREMLGRLARGRPQ
jgi:glycosyltransferase involved in cell wall biosynthesis